MRVAIVYDCLSPFSTGGGERVYRRIADILVDAGHQVDYLTRDQWSPDPSPEFGFTVVPIWTGEIYDSRGVRRIGPALAFARAAHRRLRSRPRDYDLVVASALPVLTLLAVRAALPRQVPVVGDWLEVWGLRTWLAYAGPAGVAAWFLQFLGAWSTPWHTVNSSFTADRLRRLRRSLRPVVLGLLEFAERRPRRPASVPPFALSVGRLISDKRIGDLPAAIARVRATVPDLRAVVVGDGPERSAIEAAAARHGVQDFFQFEGFTSTARLEALRGGAAVLVHPSRREGFGLVVAEAAAVGLPVVVVEGQDNAATALVDPGVNGVIANSTDPADLASAIAQVLAAGDRMRASAQAWFDRESARRTLATSVDEVLRIADRS